METPINTANKKKVDRTGFVTPFAPSASARQTISALNATNIVSPKLVLITVRVLNPVDVSATLIIMDRYAIFTATQFQTVQSLALAIRTARATATKAILVPVASTNLAALVPRIRRAILNPGTASATSTITAPSATNTAMELRRAVCTVNATLMASACALRAGTEISARYIAMIPRATATALVTRSASVIATSTTLAPTVQSSAMQ
jgi:hypothetical protein